VVSCRILDAMAEPASVPPLHVEVAHVQHNLVPCRVRFLCRMVWPLTRVFRPFARYDLISLATDTSFTTTDGATVNVNGFTDGQLHLWGACACSASCPPVALP
jgi:hypothetical protein